MKSLSAVAVCVLVSWTFLGVSRTETASVKGKTKVCYLPNWTTARTLAYATRNFTVDDVDFTHCTHVNYAFLGLDETHYTIKILSPEVDLSDNGGKGWIEKLIAKAKTAGASVLFSIGGWNESGKEAYEKLLADEALMDKFVTSVVELLNKFGAQGLDLDYEYPGCPQGSCGQYANTGKNGFSKLIIKLRAAFKESGYLLTAAVSALESKIDTYYNASVLNEYLDWVGLMTYDYSIGTDAVIGVTAPLEKVKASVDAWIGKGVDAAKIVMGVPFYGVAYTLADKAKTAVGAAASGIGQLGATMIYNDICYKAKFLNWTESTVEQLAGGTYAFLGDQWTGFDSIKDMKNKGQVIIDKGLAGFMCWAVDQDDFLNACGDGKFALLTAISNVLGSKP